MLMSRSVYLSRLRRAFLLRVHPDRFRNHPSTVRSDQASVVKALMDRLIEPDFLAWQQYKAHRMLDSLRSSQKINASLKSQAYIMERRDGSLFKSFLPLDGSVQDILHHMTGSLKEIGVNSLPEISQVMGEAQQNHGTSGPRSTVNNPMDKDSVNHQSSMFQSGIDHQYDIRSKQGRDLNYFLSSLSRNDILERRLDRTDAQAAAMQVRQTFQFQSVDATTLGWSSASVSVLLNQLLELHDEFSNKLHVSSFYPIRLLFTSDDFHTALDLYGGVLRLNPASTKIQWLEKLQLVTESSMEAIMFYQEKSLALTKQALGMYNVRFQKGYSCKSQEYFDFLDSICSSQDIDSEVVGSRRDTNKSIMTMPLTVIVESEYSSRRPQVTREGAIQLGAAANGASVRAAVAKLSGRAREQEKVYVTERERLKEAIHRVQWDLGLERVYKNKSVQRCDFTECLLRLAKMKDETQKNELRRNLTGHALGVASHGSFCHLSDDGAIVIPVDWR